MNHVTRLVPFIWPYRRKVVLSILFAVLVAIFWSLNLSVAFPVVKVLTLMEDQSLGGYVAQEIAAAEGEWHRRTERLDQIEEQLVYLDQNPSPRYAERRVELLRRQSREQAALSAASRKILLLSRFQSYVVPWLPRDNFDLLAMILGLLLLATVLKGVCLFVQEILVGSVVELTVMGLRKSCFRRVLRLDYQTLAAGGTPDLMSRFTHDMGQVAHGLTLLGGKVVREPLKAMSCLVFAFAVNWRLTLLAVLFVPVMAMVFYHIGRKLKQAGKRMMESMSRIYRTLEETFDGLKVVIAFNGARQHRRVFHRENKEYYSKAMRIVRIDALTSPTIETLGFVAALVAFLPGLYLVLRQTTSIWGIQLSKEPMDLAQLSLLYVLLAGVLDPMRKMSSIYSKIKRATAALDRVFELADQAPLVAQAASPRPMPVHRESIEFRKVDFAYAVSAGGAPRPVVLENVSLTVRAGEVIVLVGENGSGKSTLVNLLPRYFDPDRGRVLVDGVDIREVRLRDLRQQIGIVTQETLLFDETVYENIRYGRPGATPQEVEEAARRAHVTQFLDSLPEGFQSRVGEGGRQLSGGQRQRIALARAILRDPTILILDEATSAIDSTSELLIHQALREFVQGRTTFIITHTVSQSILDLATRIAVMDQGKLVAAGPHETLLESCPVYQRLYRARLQRPAEAADAA